MNESDLPKYVKICQNQKAILAKGTQGHPRAPGACGCSSSSRTTQAAFLVHASCKHMQYVATTCLQRPSQPSQSVSFHVCLCFRYCILKFYPTNNKYSETGKKHIIRLHIVICTYVYTMNIHIRVYI